MRHAKAAYSYGIGGHDDWGCSVSKTLKVPVAPVQTASNRPSSTARRQFVPHDECVGTKAETVDNRVFDTIAEPDHP